MQSTRKYHFSMRIEKMFCDLGTVVNSAATALAFLFTVGFNFLAPIKFNLFFVSFLIVADVITALMALFMVKKRECPDLFTAFKEFYTQWTSKRAFDSVPKFMFYCLLIIAGYCVGIMFDASDKYAKVATSIIAYVEIRSIIENGDKAFGLNMWELVMDYMKKLLPAKK